MRENEDLEVYYFGVIRTKNHSHCLYDDNLVRISSCGIGPFEYIDSCLTPSDEIEGSFKLHYRGSWTAVSWWDRSGDYRPGSNSTVIVNRILSIEEMVQICKKYFFAVVERQNFDIDRWK